MKDKVFYKYSGAGNTFLLAEGPLDMSFGDKTEFIEKICDPVNGFSTDGVLFLNTEKETIEWDFYNSDGSIAEMCGNAARCAVQFCKDQQILKNDQKTIRFKTLAGMIHGEIKENLIYIEMNAIKEELGWLEIEKVSSLIISRDKLYDDFMKELSSEKILSVDTGVPHLVVELKSIANYKNLFEVCKTIRGLSLFPRGTNVTLLSGNKDQEINAVTFERGVEGFTLACGTGAVAAAVYWGAHRTVKKIKVNMPGGLLQVNLDPIFSLGQFNFQTNLKSPLLIGEAKLIGQVVIKL